MTIPGGPASGNNWKLSAGWFFSAILCFHLAYTSIRYPLAGLFILGFPYSLLKLVAAQPSVRRAFYWGLATGFCAYAPQLYFFWNLFSVAAIVLWLILALWLAFFTALTAGCSLRWGLGRAFWLIPPIWTGFEYARSELYYLKFSWLNIGYALPIPLSAVGMYGAGFLALALATALVFSRGKQLALRCLITLGLALVFTFLKLPAPGPSAGNTPSGSSLKITGVQLEFPPENLLPRLLSKALNQYPDTSIFVLSECTLDGEVTPALKAWCRAHQRYLVVGGKDPITPTTYYNTAFVIGTNGEVFFKQAKSVPVQFFHDGDPAREQNVWASPWGKIGICICYDLSYRRVTDGLIRRGAQLLIVPTMDVSDWGRHQHELHSRVAPLRASEYGIPIFRLASSGISQAIAGNGDVLGKTHLGGSDETLPAQFNLPAHGWWPWDRFLAPICVVVTLVTLILTSRSRPPARIFPV